MRDRRSTFLSQAEYEACATTATKEAATVYEQELCGGEVYRGSGRAYHRHDLNDELVRQLAHQLANAYRVLGDRCRKLGRHKEAKDADEQVEYVLWEVAC